jgi:predicted nucleic acid-binding protein
MTSMTICVDPTVTCSNLRWCLKRSFIFDILIAYSAREIGAVLVSRNTGDLKRIVRAFRFDCVLPFPTSP